LSKTQRLESEWSVLQQEYDSYEKQSLWLKLISISLLALTISFGQLNISYIIVILVFWLQDAIWKTYQARIENRLLTIETGLQNKAGSSGENNLQLNSQTIIAFQYNTQFAQKRPSTVGLIFEYTKQAIRPTMIFPHAVLLSVAVVHAFSWI
jgi:hypothetical protein